MGSYSISVNEKLCASALKSANDSLDKVKKYMGASGTKSTSTIIGCVEKLNEGFRDTKEVSKLYKDFNTSLKTLETRLKNIDSSFQVIDKVV